VEDLVGIGRHPQEFGEQHVAGQHSGAVRHDFPFPGFARDVFHHAAFAHACRLPSRLAERQSRREGRGGAGGSAGRICRTVSSRFRREERRAGLQRTGRTAAPPPSS
jgi:hypothetical protein